LWGLAQRIRFHQDTATCNLPLADFTFDTVTFGTPCHFTNLSSNLGDSVHYKWDILNDGTIDYTTKDVTHTFTSPGYYTVKLTVENDSGCVASVIRDVITGPQPNTNLLIAGSTTLCQGDSVILTSNNYEEGTTFDWSTGDTSRAITVKSTGSYFCWAKNSYGISLSSETAHVQVHDVPEVMVTSFDATGGVANGSAWVEATGGSDSYSYQWSNGLSGPVLNGLAPGSYTVTVSNGNCPVIRELTIANREVTSGNIIAAEYFFDTDPGCGNGIPINTWAGDTLDFRINLPLAGLAEGFHHLYLRTRDTYGKWSLDKHEKIFVHASGTIPPPVVQPSISQAEYFINTDPGVGKGVNIPLTSGNEITKDFIMPATGLSPGFCRIYVRVRDLARKWSL
jgi:PKD repeat protein